MTTGINIVWFERDLRLDDNPALSYAIGQGNILPIYIFDDHNTGEHQLGGASRWWLHFSLQSLNESLSDKLNFYRGDPEQILTDLCSRHQVDGIYWNRRYEPWQISRDQKIKQQLLSHDINSKSFNGSVLNEPWTILKQDDSPYKIFTPYYRQAVIKSTHSQPLPQPKFANNLIADNKAVNLTSLSLLPKINWDSSFYEHWTPGEIGAVKKLREFLQNGLDHYQEGRDFPAKDSISKLSPHLHFGEISPRQIMEYLRVVPDSNNREHFIRELHWREFSYYLLFHWPTLPQDNLKHNFDFFPWQNKPEWLTRWQQGKTGYPLIDAGMRELWTTGFMHNRVRMITASFLVKNLLTDWRHGANWFLDCLVDADLASNSASWQWVAGCGTDAAPYFRIFNPTTQGIKFDRDGEYTKRFLPELKDLPNKYLFQPWQAPAEILAAANITLGEEYPRPIVDIKESRENALAAYEMAKQTSLIQ
jgi:deoxyribodipyrimidine photo-lyase